MNLSVATWNLDGWSPLRADDKARLVSAERVDVLCAQELTASRYRQMREALGDAWWGVHSLATPADAPSPRSHWGVAVFGKTAVGQPLESRAKVIGPVSDDSGQGLFWRRTVCVPVETPSGIVHVMSVHVRPGAVVRRQKLQFLENLLGWIGSVEGPLILGVDANSPGNDSGQEHYWTPVDGSGRASTFGATTPPIGSQTPGMSAPVIRHIHTSSSAVRRMVRFASTMS